MNCLKEQINKFIKKHLTNNIENIEIKRSYLKDFTKSELINLKLYYENRIEWIFYGVKFLKMIFYFISTILGGISILGNIIRLFNILINNIDYDILKIFVKIMAFNIICIVLIIFVIYMCFYSYIQNIKLMIKLIEEKIKLMEEQ